MTLAAIPPDAARWRDQTFAGMSLADKIGQLFFPMLTRDTLVAEGFAPDDLPGFCAAFRIGGGHIFGGGLEQVADWTRRAQGASRIPLLISGDIDRGGGNRIPGGALFPYQMALGAADREDLAYALGRNIAIENRIAGFNWAFGPIVDLCASPDYVRHIAAIGSDPELVARQACAQIRGIQDHGMAACAKHFPGDGHDDRDQHIVTLVNPLSEADWWRQSALPFQRSIDAGVHSIMVSGIAVPSLDPTVSADGIPVPAVFSRRLLEDVLRTRMGFAGVIVSDALNMGGMSCHHPLLERYSRAFQAGVDALLFVRRLRACHDLFEGLLRRGEITEAQIDRSVLRILDLKARLRLPAELQRPGDAPDPAMFGAMEFQDAARRLAEASVTVLKDSRRQFPPAIPVRSRVAHVVVTNRPVELELPAFDAEFAAAGHTVTTFVNPEAEEIYDRVESGEFALVVTSIHYPIQWGWCTTRCHGPFVRTLMSGYNKAHPGVRQVCVSLGSPFHIRELPGMDPFIATFGEPPCSLRAVARAILGRIPAPGRSPVGMDGYFPYGSTARH